MSPRDPDALLTDAVRAGDHAAFERLYADYHAPIYNLCARILGDREEAKDLTQETFLKAFSNLPAASAEPLKLRPWLYRVATNACLNHLRSRRGPRAGDQAALAAVPSWVDTFEQAQTVALVEASLGQMSERYRTALVLKDLHGLPPAEIAAVMEVSRPTADVLVHRARRAFKGVFAKLAGEGAAAPASLGLVLVPLGIPAALRLMPPLPHLAPVAHAAAPTQAAPPAARHLTPPGAWHPTRLATSHPVAPASAPHGAGLLAKLAAASAASKLAVGAAAALLVAGGAAGLAIHAHRDAPPAAARTVTAAASSAGGSSTVSVADAAGQPLGYWHTRWGFGTWDDRASWLAMRSWNRHMSMGYAWSASGGWMAPRTAMMPGGRGYSSVHHSTSPGGSGMTSGAGGGASPGSMGSSSGRRTSSGGMTSGGGGHASSGGMGSGGGSHTPSGGMGGASGGHTSPGGGMGS